MFDIYCIRKELKEHRIHTVIDRKFNWGSGCYTYKITFRTKTDANLYKLIGSVKENSYIEFAIEDDLPRHIQTNMNKFNLGNKQYRNRLKNR